MKIVIQGRASPDLCRIERDWLTAGEATTSQQLCSTGDCIASQHLHDPQLSILQTSSRCSVSSSSSSSLSSLSSSSCKSPPRPRQLLVEPDADSNPMNRLQAAKQHLHDMLKQHNGSPSHPEVLDAIDQLQRANTTPVTANLVNNLLVGRYHTLTAPQFPGQVNDSATMSDNEHPQYTLGRLSFHIFQPASLLCSVVRIRNEIVAHDADNDNIGDNQNNDDNDDNQNNDNESNETEHSGDNGKKRYSFDIICDIIIHTDDNVDLPATLTNHATCWWSKNRLNVKFRGGTLSSSSYGEDEEVWRRTFASAYETAASQQSVVSSIVWFVMKLVLGLRLPTDANPGASFQFEMKRSPIGWMEFLYLDDDLRVSKGNRGTIVIVERMEEC